LERAVGKDAFGEVVEERHGEFVVDGSLVRRRVVEDLANPVRLLVVMQKLVDEGNVYLLVILIIFGAVVVVGLVGILPDETTLVLIEGTKRSQFFFISAIRGIISVVSHPG